MDHKVSARYNIGRYGVSSMSIHSDSGKVLKVFNSSKSEDENWNEAVKWGKSNFSKIKDMATAKKTTRKKATGKKKTTAKKTVAKKATKAKRKSSIKLSTLDAAKVRSKLREIREIGKKYRAKGRQTSLF